MDLIEYAKLLKITNKSKLFKVMVYLLHYKKGVSKLCLANIFELDKSGADKFLFEGNCNVFNKEINKRRKQIGLPKYETSSKYFLCNIFKSYCDKTALLSRFQLTSFSRIDVFPTFLYEDNPKALNPYKIEVQKYCDVCSGSN